MFNNSHLHGGEHVREVVEQVTQPKPQTHHVVKETLEFYLNNPAYTEVYIVRCDNCGNDMCLEVVEPAKQQYYMETHHEGRRRITLGFEDAPDGYLLSHRKRLDGAMGYQCGAMMPNPAYEAQVAEMKAFNLANNKKKQEEPIVPPPITEKELIPCGNNTIIASHEEGFTRIHPSGQKYLPPLEPHQEAQLRAQLVRTAHKPDIVRSGAHTRIESFTVERLK